MEDSSNRERNLSGHIFSVSAGLVGVCLTVIGLFNLGGLTPHSYRGRADDLLTIDAGLFLAACLLSYLALRTRHERIWVHLERAADAFFLLGLTCMVLIGGLVAFEAL